MGGETGYALFMRTYVSLGCVLFATVALTISCDDDETVYPPNNGTGGSGLADQTGQSCAVADDCYEGVLHSDIQGELRCLDRVEGGYCTHLCQSDADCCAVEGECEHDDAQVCSPFESTGLMMCFLTCENEDVGELDPDDYCADFHRDFICR